MGFKKFVRKIQKKAIRLSTPVPIKSVREKITKIQTKSMPQTAAETRAGLLGVVKGFGAGFASGGPVVGIVAGAAGGFKDMFAYRKTVATYEREKADLAAFEASLIAPTPDPTPLPPTVSWSPTDTPARVSILPYVPPGGYPTVSGDTFTKGTETWYFPKSPFAWYVPVARKMGA